MAWRARSRPRTTPPGPPPNTRHVVWCCRGVAQALGNQRRDLTLRPTEWARSSACQMLVPLARSNPRARSGGRRRAAFRNRQRVESALGGDSAVDLTDFTTSPSATVAWDPAHLFNTRHKGEWTRHG